ncbi:MAG: hypothetical protein FJ214_00725 [Ignavibacteria bacterium]|nr:hypothetical protein [Ignavibacteria bacterium]
MKKIILLFLILISAAEIFPSGGSLYSRHGLGDLYFSYTARRMGLGELGIASLDYDFLNNVNPASWSSLRLTRFETGVLYHGNNISSSSNSTFQTQTIFTGLMFGFPIDRENGISFVTGIVPYSNVSYEVVLDQESVLTDPYKLTFKGEGGISKIFAGLSYRLPFEFSLGAALDYYNGELNYSTMADFSTSNFFSGAMSKKYRHNGIGYSIGLISSNISKLFGIKEVDDIRLGLTYSGKTTLTTDTLSIYTTPVGELTNSSSVVETEIPNRLGIGLSLKLNPQYLIVADYLFQPFTELTINGKKINTLRDFYKASIGLEYRNMDTRAQSLWEQLILRGGLSYEQTQYEINKKGIEQFSIFAGCSMPLGFDSTVDFAFQIGKRGTKENNLLSENFYKFSITLSIGELWFVTTDR